LLEVEKSVSLKAEEGEEKTGSGIFKNLDKFSFSHTTKI
jgi:hypothetical protein